VVDLPDYAMRKAGEWPIGAVCRAIARKTGLTVVTCRSDGYRLEQDKPIEAHYQLTLGSRIDKRFGGGYSVEGELWVAVPIGGSQD
jgi:hypothetical protein